MPEKSRVGTAVIVLSEDKKNVLMGKRKNAYKAGEWGMPGGRVELGENVEETAKRELQEEAGLVSQEIAYVGAIKENQGDHDFVTFGFVCTAWSGDVTLCEPDKCEEWLWLPLNNLPTNILIGHARILAMYLDPTLVRLESI